MKIRRFLPLLLGLPLALITTGVLAYQYRIQLGNRLQLLTVLPYASPPDRNASIIIFAPHCDDESIATGGLIQRAIEAGCDIKVVLLTNGDGFRIAAEREFRNLRVTPDDYVRFAETRQEETRRAAAALGLSKDNLIFLGYPDRGLSPMWISHWKPDRPYRSHYTKLTQSSHDNSYRQDAVYCGQHLFEDVRSILEEYAPDDIYIPHHLDDHSDHSAAYAFIMAAVLDLQAADAVQSPRVHTYLVHRGDWPRPAGWRPQLGLRPPAALADIDTAWDTLPITDEMVIRKREAIREHRTQVAIMGTFLNSFARKNEVFGRTVSPTIPLLPKGSMTVDGRTDDWQGMDVAMLYPTSDHVMRGIRKSGDVKSIHLCADDDSLYVRVDFAKSLSKQVDYHVTIRSFGGPGSGDTTLWATTIRPPGRATPAGTHFAWKGPILELRVPRAALGDAKLHFISVETAAMRLRVDRTGWREFILPQPYRST